MQKSKRTLFLSLLAVPASLFLGCSVHSYLANRSFVDFTDRMFVSEIQESTLNLHYTLSDPASFGITDYPVTLGNAGPAVEASGGAALENYKGKLEDICRHCLSKDNRLTYDILDTYLDTRIMGTDFYLYGEPLGPTIGTQAQLPVLLAEYAFRNERDISDYLNLLKQMDTCYASLLDFEQARSEAGLFMSDSSADAIIAQCQSFIANPEENFLLEIFNEKTDSLDFLSPQKKASYKSANRKAVLGHVIPAYELLIRGLTELKGTGKNEKGLCWLPKGKAYYEYLVRQSTGRDENVAELAGRIQQQLQTDYAKLRSLIKENPSLLTNSLTGSLSVQEPADMLTDLQSKLSEDFPEPPGVSCEVKYVHSSLEEFLSPAFYLTPPIDLLNQNVIYINRACAYTPLELYTTLAHEGYPGHLYQTVYSGSVSSNKVRSLLDFGGYVEGWATYVEMYAYDMADTDRDTASLFRLNRSIMLGISSLMDIAVHYYGYSRADAAAWLTQLGFSDTSSAESLYTAVLEAPANYLKYYVGYLSFLDLRNACSRKEGEAFSLREFHRRILELGPMPFSVLEQRLGVEL